MHEGLKRLTWVLVNNGTDKKMSGWHSELPVSDDEPQPIILYYKNVMSFYKEDESAIKYIVKRGVETMAEEKLKVYCLL